MLPYLIIAVGLTYLYFSKEEGTNDTEINHQERSRYRSSNGNREPGSSIEEHCGRCVTDGKPIYKKQSLRGTDDNSSHGSDKQSPTTPSNRQTQRVKALKHGVKKLKKEKKTNATASKKKVPKDN